MAQIIRKLLIAWLLLLGALLLTQALPLPAGARLGYGLMWVVALTSPVAAGLLLWLAAVRLRMALYRLRVLRRAARWKGQAPPTPCIREEWGK
jgi:hypothetical protein